MKYPSFSATLILYKRSSFLCEKIQTVVHMIVWYQWQCHLFIVTSCGCLDNVIYSRCIIPCYTQEFPSLNSFMCKAFKFFMQGV